MRVKRKTRIKSSYQLEVSVYSKWWILWIPLFKYTLYEVTYTTAKISEDDGRYKFNLSWGWEFGEMMISGYYNDLRELRKYGRGRK